jgi:MFS transporter, ACS family, tartrate transporter
MQTLSESDLGRTVVSKLTRRLLPFLFLLYIVNYLDRINVGFAALQMRAQLGFSDKVYGMGAGIFFAGYFFFQVPSNLGLARVGARKWIAAIMVLWGTISAAMIFVATPRSFYLLRFLLGASEAGFFPGMILYLKGWFPPPARAKAMALFMTAAPLAGVVGGPISGALLGLHAANLSGWQWLFLMEGLPAVLLGVVVLLCLTDSPEIAAWLSSDERTWLTGELRRERLAHPAAASDKIFAAFTQRKVWLLVLVYLGETTSFYGISLWLPSMIKNASGDSNLVVGLLSVIPYLMTAVAMVLVGMHSDHTGERKWHLAGCAFAGSIGLAGAAYATSTVASMAMLSLTMMAGFSMMGPFWATSTEVLSEISAVAGIALINSFGNLGGFLGPYTIGLVRTWTGSFRGGLLAVAVLLGLAGGLALLAYGQNSHKPRVPALP